MKIPTIWLILLILSFCSCQKKTLQPLQELYVGQELNFEKTLNTIAFGSCSRQDLKQVMWPVVNQNKPDLWIWLGDNIYGDSEDMNFMKREYLKQKSDPEYQKLRSASMVIGVWDDHDYGTNDGNKTYSKRKESKSLMLDFLDVPKANQARNREGTYQSYQFGPTGKSIKLILLDTRYFQDVLERNPSGSPRYFTNETGDILGEAQWEWLEKELEESSAQLHIICSSIQVIPNQHPFEKWANFPKARLRLFDLFKKHVSKKLLLLSGDRHMAEISKLELEDLNEPIYECTASGLTHSYEEADEENIYRHGPLIGKKNFGLLHIDWSNETPRITLEIKGLENNSFYKLEIK